MSSSLDHVIVSVRELNWRAAPRRRSTLFYNFHGKPHTIWYESWQAHANKVQTLLGISYCSHAFGADEAYLSDMLCAPPAERSASRVAWRTPRLELLELLSPSALATRFPAPVPTTPFAVWPVALRCRVGSLAACRAELLAGEVPFVESDGLLTVAAEHTAGAIGEFTTSA